jgi:hypothetical protein
MWARASAGRSHSSYSIIVNVFCALKLAACVTTKGLESR